MSDTTTETGPAKKPAAKKSRAKQKKTASARASGRTYDTTYFTKTMEDIMTNGKNPFDKMSQDAAKLYKENQDALTESGRIYAKHLEGITQYLTGLTQEAVEKNTEAFKSLWGCKTLQELTETQSKLAQENFDDFMAGATKLSELSVKLAAETFEPLNDQFTKTFQKSMAA